MSLEYLLPLDPSFCETFSENSDQTLFSTISLHTQESGLPDLQEFQLALFGVQEGRNSGANDTTGYGLDSVREHFYRLFPGNWSLKIADLGDVPAGNNVSDTYFAVKEIVSELIKNNIIPIILGGGQDITYANYRAYDALEQTVNLVAVDAKFDLGKIEDELTSNSYLNKIVMEEPVNLFNYSNIGYQTYFNSQEEIHLIESLDFDAYRLGQAKNLELVEPIMRDADIVSIDIGAVRASDAPANANASPNGFFGDEICAIARYAGISDKVTSFGIYEFNNRLDSNGQTAHLVAQMIWYFVEGVNFRAKDYPFCTKEKYIKYMVPFEDEQINFYKSNKSGRWWLEINSTVNNKYKRHALIPCTYQDYLDAANQNLPERWYKAQRKMS